MKTLIITAEKKEYFFQYIQSDDILVVNVLKNNYKSTKAIRRIPFLASFSFSGGLKSAVKKYDKIIVFDSAYTFSLVLYLKWGLKINKLYLYFWNPVEKTMKRNCSNLLMLAKRFADVYSFDPTDCKNYNLKFSPMIYSEDIKIPQQIKQKYNVFFLGAGKDRISDLVRIYEQYLSEINDCKLVIVGESNLNHKAFEVTNKRYTYTEYLENVFMSQALLDVPQHHQEGNTIRVVECLFLKKKLITTNQNLVLYDFYNANNIFIIGKDDFSNIKIFLEKPFMDIKPDILNKYEVKSWVNTFK